MSNFLITFKMITKTLIQKLSYSIIGCAIEVHKQMGPGLLESIYELCMLEEMKLRGINAQSQVFVPVVYKEKYLDKEFKIDLVVEGLIIVELKAIEMMHPVYEAQLLSHLKLSGIPKGLLINFNCLTVRDQLTSRVTENFEKLPD